MTTRTTGILLCSLTLLLFACGDRDDNEPAPRYDLGQDIRPDVTPDVTPDTPADLAPVGFTIHDIQDESSPEYPGRDVSVTFSGIVTAIDTTGDSAGDFYVQDPAGGPYSGIFIYNEGGSAVNVSELQVGQLVEITGTVVEYYDLTEVQASTMSISNAVPAPLTPETVNAADVATDGSLAEAYEGVLVQVVDTAVTEVGDYGVFTVTGGLLVDDTLYYYTDIVTPTVGYEFDRIAGVMDFSYGERKLLPRNADDMEGEEVVVPELTIYDIQDESSSEYPGRDVSVTFSGIVTAIDTTGSSAGDFFVQDPAGGPYSGIFIYNEAGRVVNVSELQVGHLVEITGTVVEHYDLTEVQVSAMSISDAVPAPLTPETVNAADVATDGSLAEAYEGVLVQVVDVSITEIRDEGQYGVFEITGGLLVDDTLYYYTDTYNLVVGNEFDRIAGVLDYSYGERKLYPRSAADLVAQ